MESWASPPPGRTHDAGMIRAGSQSTTNPQHDSTIERVASLFNQPGM